MFIIKKYSVPYRRNSTSTTPSSTFFLPESLNQSVDLDDDKFSDSLERNSPYCARKKQWSSVDDSTSSNYLCKADIKKGTGSLDRNELKKRPYNHNKRFNSDLVSKEGSISEYQNQNYCTENIDDFSLSNSLYKVNFKRETGSLDRNRLKNTSYNHSNEGFNTDLISKNDNLISKNEYKIYERNKKKIISKNTPPNTNNSENLSHGLTNMKTDKEKFRRFVKTDSKIYQNEKKFQYPRRENLIKSTSLPADGREARESSKRSRAFSLPGTGTGFLEPDFARLRNLNCINTEINRNVRDNSKAGLRSCIPFGVRSTTNSAAGSCGNSDTQSQGSSSGVPDSKSESLTPEGSRKGTSPTSSNQSGPSGVSSTNGNGKLRQASQTPEGRATTALRQEVETLRAEITKARQTILHMQEREKKLKDRLGDHAVRGSNERMLNPASGLPSKIENLNLGEKRPSALLRRYGHLYDQNRLDALDALDALPDLSQAEELKAKLLFSVVVLAFRSVTTSSVQTREDVRRLLQLQPSRTTKEGKVDIVTTQGKAVELAVSSYLSHNIDCHDLSRNVEEVCEQIWATLYDYPCLKTSESLLKYAKACVRVAWGLVNQNPPYVLEYESRTFNEKLHIRFHSSDIKQNTIKTYLWPALLEGNGGKCVHQAVVIT